MKIKKLKIYDVLLFLLVVLPIYQDSPLSKYLGAAGYYVLMPFCLICYCFYVAVKGRRIHNRYLKCMTNLGMWLIVITFVAIIIWIIMGKSFIVVGEILPIKGIKVILQYFSYPAYVALIIKCVRKSNLNRFCMYTFYTLILLTVIGLIEQLQIPYAFESLHFAASFPYYRTRLLTMESSWTTMLIFVYGGISFYYGLEFRKKLIVYVSVICFVILIINTGSKSVLSAIVLSFIIYILLSFKKLKKSMVIKLLIICAVLIIAAQIILPRFLNSFRNDIENYTSVATRLYTLILGFGIGIVFPIGVGGAVYLGVLRSALAKFLPIFQNLKIKFNTSEILGLISKNSDTALTVKSGILQYNMYWGILGTLYLFRNFTKLGKNIYNLNIKNKNLLLSVYWTAVILIVISLNFSFEFWLLYAFMVVLIEEYEKIYMGVD